MREYISVLKSPYLMNLNKVHLINFVTFVTISQKLLLESWESEFVFQILSTISVNCYLNRNCLSVEMGISEILRNISKTSARVSSGFQTQETFETTRPQVEHKMT